MKRLTLVLFTVFAVALSVTAQRAIGKGLSVSGSVVKIGSTCIDGKPIASILLYVQFRNDSESRILVLPPELFFERRVRFAHDAFRNRESGTVAGDSLLYNPYLENPFSTRTRDDYDPVSNYISKLKPTNKRFKQIEPGSYYEFQDMVWLKKGFKFKTNQAQERGKCEDDKAVPEPEYPSFDLEYHFSAKEFEGETDLLRDLRDRWKPFGDLILDSNGDISYKTEKILIFRP